MKSSNQTYFQSQNGLLIAYHNKSNLNTPVMKNVQDKTACWLPVLDGGTTRSYQAFEHQHRPLNEKKIKQRLNMTFN